MNVVGECATVSLHLQNDCLQLFVAYGFVFSAESCVAVILGQVLLFARKSGRVCFARSWLFVFRWRRVSVLKKNLGVKLMVNSLCGGQWLDGTCALHCIDLRCDVLYVIAAVSAFPNDSAAAH